MSHLCYRSPTKQVSAVLGADFPGAFFKADLCYILGLCHNVDVLGDDWMEYAVRGKLMVFYFNSYAVNLSTFSTT